MSEAAIETAGLTRRFGTFTAVDGLNLRVERGEIFGFLGANGAGKTTAIRMLCGLLPPSAGEGRVAGKDIRGDKAAIRARIGYMAQKFSLYPDLKVEENLRLFGRLYGLDRNTLGTRLRESAAWLGLDPLLPKITGELPWGWQQRLSLACATLHRPEILFLDEPTGSVDPLSRRRFWDLLARLAGDGVTVFITSHYMDEIEYCDRLSIMVRGRIAALGSPAGLKREFGRDTLEAVFLRCVGSPA